MPHGVHANFEPFEGIVSASTTHTFARKSRQIVITNDSTTKDLSYKFNASETNGTIKPKETLSLHFTSNQIIIDGSTVPYRIWVYG